MGTFHSPAHAGAVFFLDNLHNLATPTVQDTALIIRDQFQSFGIDGVNLSVCFTAKRDYFSGIRSFTEPAVRFYNNKCVLEPFTVKETAEYTRAVFGSTSLDTQKLEDWLFSKTLGHPYFLAFISRELWSNYHARPFANAAQLWPAVFSRLEQEANLTMIWRSFQKKKSDCCEPSLVTITKSPIQHPSRRNSRTHISRA